MALVKEFATGDLEAGLMEYLTRALSNDPDFGNGGLFGFELLHQFDVERRDTGQRIDFRYHLLDGFIVQEFFHHEGPCNGRLERFVFAGFGQVLMGQINVLQHHIPVRISRQNDT